MQSKASAIWLGDLKGGKGTMTTRSGVLTNAAYTHETRFVRESGSNPEEMIAAAHAACFSMALSADLGRAGIKSERVETTATISFDMIEGMPTLTKSHLVVKAKVPGADHAKFMEIANGTKVGCPISRVLKLEITMDAALEA